MSCLSSFLVLSFIFSFISFVSSLLSSSCLVLSSSLSSCFVFLSSIFSSVLWSCCCCVLLRVMLYCVVLLLCLVVLVSGERHAEKPRVSVQNVTMCTLKTSPCVPAPPTHVFQHAHVVPAYTRRLNMHTETFWTGEQGGGRRQPRVFHL